MLPEPGVEFAESHATTLIEIHQKRKRSGIGEGQTISVHSEKCGCYSHRHPFVAVDERMILRYRLSQSAAASSMRSR
jgi:hypothetical protein